MIAVSSETEEERTFTFRQLHDEVNAVASTLALCWAAAWRSGAGVYADDCRSAYYSCWPARALVPIHSGGVWGFASHSVVARIDDSKPVLIVSADAGARGLVTHSVAKIVRRCDKSGTASAASRFTGGSGLAKMARVMRRDVDFASLRHPAHRRAGRRWHGWNPTQSLLHSHTSGTTGKPKDCFSVMSADMRWQASMDTIFGSGKAGGVFFCASDIGWVVGHSYTVCAPAAGRGWRLSFTKDCRPGRTAACEWRNCRNIQVSRMFSAPTAIRVLKNSPTAEIPAKHDLSSLEMLYLAGEPAGRADHQLGEAIRWMCRSSTTTGRPNPAGRLWRLLAVWMTDRRVLEAPACRVAITCGCSMGSTGEPCGVNEKDAGRWRGISRRAVFGPSGRRRPLCEDVLVAVFPSGVRPLTGASAILAVIAILGRTDDVINVADIGWVRVKLKKVSPVIQALPEVAVVGVKRCA